MPPVTVQFLSCVAGCIYMAEVVVSRGDDLVSEGDYVQVGVSLLLRWVYAWNALAQDEQTHKIRCTHLSTSASVVTLFS